MLRNCDVISQKEIRDYINLKATKGSEFTLILLLSTSIYQIAGVDTGALFNTNEPTPCVPVINQLQTIFINLY